MTQSNQPPFEPLSRHQVLLLVGITALLLFIVGNLWRFLGNVSLMNWQFSNLTLVQGGAIALMIIGLSTLLYECWGAYRRSVDLYLDVVLKPLAISDAIWLGLLPGLSEEFLFRGIMLSAFGFTWFGLLISSLIFGVLHIGSAQQWPYGLWASAVGLILGYSAIATGNLLVPVIAHIITNFTSIVIWKWRQSKET